ncbi:hypothetical protein NECAME_02291 [Necator americanus]|uniref:Kringle-like domain-containing protein n=1 Tax=Necator americanus TaxID=51031 RepID=W2TIQ1_NECAM|nr:hypothetical protein NECAME_02291 [Necator americanus]ETN80892.1 hypothetical protein NECAME_02291 [Necator americanus]
MQTHTVKGENCLVWKEVYEGIVKDLGDKPEELRDYQTRQIISPISEVDTVSESMIAKAEEVMLHNKCRRLDLAPEHPLKDIMKMTNPGPWCYVRRKVKKI